MTPAKTTKAKSAISTKNFENDFGIFNDPNYRVKGYFNFSAVSGIFKS